LSDKSKPAKFRSELKYFFPNHSLPLLEARLQAVLRPDVNAIDGRKYTITSLYFDDLMDSCLNANYMGVSDRFKYRIRFYNHDLSHINLEKKIKHSNLAFKKKAKLSPESFRLIMENDSSSLLRESKDDLITEFCMMMQSRGFTPKAIVEYDRLAFVEPVSNTRITLDTNIVSSNDFNQIASKQKLVFPILENGMQILEVKFDDFFPEYIRRAVQMDTLNQSTISKYCFARQTLTKNWRY